jgi:hypothetical protein
MKGRDDEEVDTYSIYDDYDSGSDIGAGKNTTSQSSFSTDSKKIVMLPYTTLEYSEDTP